MARRVKLRFVAALAVAVAYFMLAEPAADAAYPGRNGVIAVAREGPFFSEDGERLGAWTLWTVDPQSGRTRQLTHVPRRCGQEGWSWSDSEPSYSASGRLLTYYHEDSCDPRTKDGLYVMRADGSQRRLIREETGADARRGDIPEYPALSPSGEFLAFDLQVASTYIVRVERGARERALSNCPSRVRPTGLCPLARYASQVQPMWRPTGGRLALTLGGGSVDAGHIGTVDTRGLNLHLVTRSRRDAMPDWSPTGDRIVFQREKEIWPRVKGDILTRAAQAQRPHRPRRLTATRDAFFPAWSPDGRHIAFIRTPELFEPHGSLWIMRASDGGGQRLVARRIVADRISWQPRPRR